MPLTPQQVYVPGSWVQQDDLFVGRTRELRHAHAALDSPGMNLIVYGHRGLGKTTFVHHLDLYREEEILFLDCGPEFSLETFIGRLFNKLSIQQTSSAKSSTKSVSGRVGGKFAIVSGSGQVQREISSQSKEFPDAFLSVDYFADKLAELSRPTILVLDEFDAVRSAPDYDKICRFLVGLMKACARRAGTKDNLFFKLIIVGVGTSVSDLIGEHRKHRKKHRRNRNRQNR